MFCHLVLFDIKIIASHKHSYDNFTIDKILITFITYCTILRKFYDTILKHQILNWNTNTIIYTSYMILKHHRPNCRTFIFNSLSKRERERVTSHSFQNILENCIIIIQLIIINYRKKRFLIYHFLNNILHGIRGGWTMRSEIMDALLLIKGRQQRSR